MAGLSTPHDDGQFEHSHEPARVTPPLDDATSAPPPITSHPIRPARPRFGPGHDPLSGGLAALDRDALRWRPVADQAVAHHPALLASLLARVMAALRQPVEAVTLDGQERFQLLGIALIQRDSGEPEGQRPIRAWLWRPQDDAMVPVPVPDAAFTVAPCPEGWHWLEAIVHAWGAELQALRPELADAVRERYLHAVFGWLKRHLRGHADLRRLRQRVQAALQLDAVTLTLARHLRPNCTDDPGRVSARAWNLAVQHREALLEIQRALLAALPLYAALLADPDEPLPPHPPRDAALQLRLYLWARGLRPAIWRMLHHARARLLVAVLDTYRGPLAAAMVNHLRVLQDLDLQREPPAEIVRAIWRRDGNAGYRWPEYFDEIGACAHWSHVIRAYQRARAPTQARGLARLHPQMCEVVGWIHAGRPAPFDKRQRHVGWRWLVASARAWAERERAAASGAQHWPVPEPIAGDRWRLEFIASAVDLWDEGQAMHHCAFDERAHCAEGGVLMASLRQADGRRVATVQFNAEVGTEATVWTLAQVRGPLNADVSPTWLRAARRAADALNDQAWSLPELRDEPEELEEPPLDEADAGPTTTDSAPRGIWFAVDDAGTITWPGADDAPTRADVLDLDERDLHDAADIAALVQRQPDAATRVADVIEHSLEDLIERLDEGDLSRAQARRLQRLIDAIEADALEALDDWVSWCGERGLADLRETLRDWFQEEADLSEHPRRGPQGAALAWFEDLDSQILHELGVVIVDGECPGSSYFGAELRVEREWANLRAGQLGQPCRFLAQGEPLPADAN